ncbi:putative trna wybutosine-synthesizing protein [Eutypa lata UCREL1]|uniref:tRNA wybutosine-synthesizing protein 2 n=1 Tax=Eutypa lata (strain UCR-EL1) TaxID=1287681 RepID=M7S9L2_EUTLA|nr:putative trna wybutosine-synthesizing protein [Eutypa lata UCREL1]
MNSQQETKSKPKRKKAPSKNPIEAALTAWFRSFPLPEDDQLQLIAQAPKRWTVYEPMALLPTGAFGSTAWREILHSVDSSSSEEKRVDQLWKGILSEISKKQKAQLTHLAVNEGIPLHHTNTTTGEGPQDNGIFQTWAPRWTMFSRGNVKEKARLLDFHDPDRQPGEMHLEHRSQIPLASLCKAYAVDLYAGIGYFVFSYARLGMRVLCWELNPWSVEGLRRGARGNGWSVRVVQRQELSSSSSMGEMLAGGEQITVFLEDNARAVERIAELQRQRQADETTSLANVLHVNCGLLPRSDLSWGDAWDIVGGSEKAWLHLHENVGVADIERRRGEIERWFGELAKKKDSGVTKVYVDHVEQVKTFAPVVFYNPQRVSQTS